MTDLTNSNTLDTTQVFDIYKQSHVTQVL